VEKLWGGGPNPRANNPEIEGRRGEIPTGTSFVVQGGGDPFGGELFTKYQNSGERIHSKNYQTQKGLHLSRKIPQKRITEGVK